MKIVKKWMILAVAVMTAAACHHGTQSSDKAKADSTGLRSHADSIVEQIMKKPELAQRLAGIDSLEAAGMISNVHADFQRGFSYYKENKPRFEEYYYKRALEHEVTTDEERDYRYMAAGALTGVYMMKSDYEGALRLGLSIIEEMKQTHPGSHVVMSKLYNSIGSAQLSLGRKEEAAMSFEQAYTYASRLTERDSSISSREAVINDVCNIAIFYLNAHSYSEVPQWLSRVDSLTDDYAKSPDADLEYVDVVKGSVYLYRAVLLQHANNPSEAAKAYSDCLGTKFGKSLDGLFDATDYLMPAHRYKEAADNFKLLDNMLSEWGIVLSLDNIQQYLFPKYRANVEAGRKDSAIAVGMKILTALDTAIVAQKRSDAAELATIYDTQQKETEIARQQAQIASKDYELSRQRNIGLLIAMVLLTAFFVFYILYRRKAARRLANVRAAQERMESELRIAREIQMSMVPNEFPATDKLDLYAQMTPAREVGGDLYDYLITDNQLYFCVGDVSGKGVPASLFMAQTTRLFRALAKQRFMPDIIANRVNDELAENNESGMFVTMFIGLVNLKTGRLDFCNCGHNPPVIGGGDEGGQFLKMESNAPIGLWPGLTFIGEQIACITNRPLFIYTDGLNEAENLHQEQFGEERLLAFLRKTRYQSSQQIIGELAKEVARHRTGAEPNDDLTMMCLNLSS